MVAVFELCGVGCGFIAAAVSLLSLCQGGFLFAGEGLLRCFQAMLIHAANETEVIPILAKCSSTSRLETRTKESDMCASALGEPHSAE